MRTLPLSPLLLVGTLLGSPAVARAASIPFEVTTTPAASFSPPNHPAVHVVDGTDVPAGCPSASDSRVMDLSIVTPSLSVSATDVVHARVIVPKGWSPSSTRTWPVLYALAGYGGGYPGWSCATFLEQYVADADVIAVMPDGTRAYTLSGAADALTGGIPSFYSNWVSPSTDGSPEQWETFHLNELWSVLQGSFHASSLRAIAGLSEGGLGATGYAARNPGMFAAVASFSGLLDTMTTAAPILDGFQVVAGQNPNAPWGAFPGTPAALLFGSQWPDHNPTLLAPALVGVPLFVSAGNGTSGTLPGEVDDGIGFDPVEALVDNWSHDFTTALTAANGGPPPGSLTTDFYGSGTHSWAYWDREMCRALPMLLGALGVSYSPVACP